MNQKSPDAPLDKQSPQVAPQALLQQIPVKLTHSQHVESSCGILHEKASVRKHRRGGVEHVNSPLGKFSQIGFELAERQLNWVEVWRVRGQILDFCTAGPD